MNRREFLVRTGTLAAGAALAPFVRAELPLGTLAWDDLPVDSQGERYAEGLVFENRNGSGRRDGQRGIGGVCVSNGREVVRTDRNGRWKLPVTEDTILFVIKPSGWAVPLGENRLPRFYYIHKPAGSPAYKHPGVAPTGALPTSIDFGLTRQREEDRFRMVLFGDPQPRNQKEIDYMAHDVIEQVARDVVALRPHFGLSLGDEMFDNLNLYDSLNRTIGTVGLPWYNTVGNHDMNYDAPDDSTSTETFQRVYGPPYYAFDWGKVHFIVLDDVVWHGKEQRGYHGEITERQLEFVRNDLSHVPKDRLVVVAMHIPLVDVKNREELYRLLEDRPRTLSLSAHTHIQAQYFLTQPDGWRGRTPHHHLNHATVCGSWWEGALDERGIPHATMADGTPNGYSIMEFDGTTYKVTFRAASRPPEYQMSLWLPEAIISAESATTELVANVFAGTERSKVEMRVGDSGPWRAMTRDLREDPHYQAIKAAEALPKPPNGLKLPAAQKTRHIWVSTLPPNLPVGTHSVHVRTTDMYGQMYEDRRIVRVQGTESGQV